MGRQLAVKTVTELRGLHAVLEARLKPQSILFVTGATEGDGAATVAQGITDMYRASGASVALVRVAAPGAEISYLPGARGEIVAPSASSSRSEIESIAQTWRENFDIVVVESAPVLDNPIAPRLAAIADGTVLALAHGRKVVAQDSSTAKFLSTVGAEILGIVTTKSKARGRSNWFASLLGSKSKERVGRSSEASKLFLKPFATVDD